jgi:hypothetical protein
MDRGQAVTEFAIVLPLFVIFIFGIIDLGRAIYIYNGVSQASREIARAASVHPGNPLGSSSQVQDVIDIQKALVFGMSDPKFHCEDTLGKTVPGDGSGGCAPGDVVRVEVGFAYHPVSLFGFLEQTQPCMTTSIKSLCIRSSSSNVVQ